MIMEAKTGPPYENPVLIIIEKKQKFNKINHIRMRNFRPKYTWGAGQDGMTSKAAGHWEGGI